MVETINRTLEIIRMQPKPQSAWAEVVSLCRDIEPSRLWELLPVPDIERDILAATDWLSSQIRALPDANGIYFGLDTLNMDQGRGTNVEIGGSQACNPSQDKIEWVYGKLTHGRSHLIRGLFELQQVYSQPKWEPVFSFADYILFLGYSGVVLGQAFHRLSTDRGLLSAWGFHDGDLFALPEVTGQI